MSNYRLENSTCRYPYKHMEYPKAGLQRHADDNGFHNTDLLVDIPVITGRGHSRNNRTKNIGAQIMLKR